ncbi:MAG: ornithine--oxo-acid transaminase [candidate division WOR-3 bacterium]
MIQKLLNTEIELFLDSLTKEELENMKENHLAPNYRPFPVWIKRGSGSRVYDIDGKEYLDFIGCYSALSHGHLNRRIIERAKKQMERLTLTGRHVIYPELVLFAKVLAEYSGMEMVLPMNTGAEAVETALKTARRWGYRIKKVPKDKAEIIVMERNFHGRTITVISFSTNEEYRDGFGPFTPGFKVVKFGDLKELKKKITKNTVAVLFEPIQAEGGVYLPYDGFLKDVRKLCDEENILMILDEIQTGMGRTGKPFAYMWEDIKPDLITIGKAIGGGIMPVSAVAGKREILSLMDPGSHGSTFGGNPLACVIGIESILEMEREKLPEQAREKGEYLMKKLKEIDSRKIKEIRGKGLLIGLEINKEYGTGKKLAEILLKHGIITKETHLMTVRITPPLTITYEEIDEGIERLKKGLEEL